MKKNILKWNLIALIGVLIGFSSCGEEISVEKEKKRRIEKEDSSGYARIRSRYGLFSSNS